MDVRQHARAVREYMGVLRKRPIKEVVEALASTQQFGVQLPNYGDDTAVIPWNRGYLLLAADGIMAGLLKNEPYAAGKAAVMVTVNDVYSMGGRPIGLVNVLASGDDTQRAQIVEGIKKGCHKLQVPMLGGHLHPDAPLEHPSLSVAILGYARSLLRSHLAQPGDHLILCVDLQGRPGCHSVASWDANSGKTSEQLLNRLEVLPLIAEAGLARAAKDVSNAGILGTASIMMENSNKGAVVHLDAIPKPDGLPLEDWVRCFQSYGFILSVPPDHAQQVIGLFQERYITARSIGRVSGDPTVILVKGDEAEILFDFRKDAITGIRYGEDGSAG
ncbi:MAG: methanogenesis marker 2 protein [Deltaproteobacteria bacterium]|nr:methanogenesis marker 2 protein [Deltaproteobacteria bacterium]